MQEMWKNLIDLFYDFVSYPFEYILSLFDNIPQYVATLFNVIPMVILTSCMCAIIYAFLIKPFKWLCSTLGGFLK